MINRRTGINIDGYFIEWDTANKKIVITPTERRGHFTFGLGNAVVSVDVENPPEELTRIIDDDPDFDINKLAVPIDYATSHLVQPAKNMVKKEKRLQLSSGRIKKFEYYEGDIEQWEKASGSGKISGLHIHKVGIRTFR